MDLNSLAERLRDPDPRVRVETLRILAMVEETRALGAVGWLYQHDPEPGVREVANWAGRLLWEAHKGGHSTQRAVEEMFRRKFSPERQKYFLQTMQFVSPRTRNRKFQKFVEDEEYRRRLNEVMRVPGFEEESVSEEEDMLSLPPPNPPSNED
jgi:hypothetical protein